MSKTAIIQARVEPELKQESEALLRRFGLSVSEYINMALSQMVLEERVPFSSRIPNQETMDAVNEDLSDAKRYDSVEKLMSDIWPKDV